MMGRSADSEILAASFDRPGAGIVWEPVDDLRGLPYQSQVAWQSNGGGTRGHFARTFPFSADIRLPDVQAQPTRIYLLGVFALFAGKEHEAFGTPGASLQFWSDRDVILRQDFINGRHYSDSTRLDTGIRIVGDGTSIEAVGECTIDGEVHRVDLITIDVPKDLRPRRLLFKDLGSPASFVIFDVFAEFQDSASCPFKRNSTGVSLAELGAAVRVGDRLKFTRAIDQLERSIDEAEDLDEARGQALTFLAVVTAATLESGGLRSSHRLQLEAARELDKLDNRDDVRHAIRSRILEVTDNLFTPSESPSDRLVDRALAIVERHFAKDLTDAMVAAQLGLSTSHFRFLFRQATGQPFHKYVVALRLEKAKQMLLEQEIPVSQVAAAVGFTGLSHFSRAFAQRFSASPSQVRRSLG